ncbi:hypothetical protein DH2020_045975 [Rehmannia glutinosa]|uniref:F-box domain-containing protein n=1 Tax=Rehmannia glutinosa TaxID=99300 RepID=A0ABR0UD76_REHGL
MDRKRVKIDSEFQPKKRAKRCHGDDDRISQLPDDILVIILSFLSLTEAARTSVLSSRWINLWKHTSSLNFDAESALQKIAEPEVVEKKYELLEMERPKYIKWVKRVLQSHKAPTLKEFRICFALSRSNRNAITRWLKFAFARKVERLELDLDGELLMLSRPYENYTFPEELLTRSIGAASIDFKSLRALSLKFVNVSGEAVEFFLRNCPLLEKLVVRGTEKISNLEVCGPSLMLKHLELCNCYHIKSIMISAPNLTSLSVSILKGLVLVNVPMLVELSVSNGIDPIKYLIPALACCISQLEILALQLHNPLENKEDYKFPELPKLKKLVINYGVARRDESLIQLTPLIRASPYLEEFVFQVCLFYHIGSDREFENTLSFPHQHLKMFKFCGYYGGTSDFELVRYILENCVALEKMIIDPHYQLWGRVPLPRDKLDAEQTARKYAEQQLKGKLPQHIELVIL